MRKFPNLYHTSFARDNYPFETGGSSENGNGSIFGFGYFKGDGYGCGLEYNHTYGYPIHLIQYWS